MISHSTVKLFAAMIGGSAVVTIGALSATTATQPAPLDLAKGASMSIGATTPATTPSTAPAVAQAVPKMRGPAPLPSEEQAAK